MTQYDRDEEIVLAYPDGDIDPSDGRTDVSAMVSSPSHTPEKSPQEHDPLPTLHDELTEFLPVGTILGRCANEINNDPTRPICKRWLSGKCLKKCLFYHPPIIDAYHIKHCKRQSRRCFCGALQKSILNRRALHDEDAPLYYVVCGRTRRSMKRCM